MAKNAHKPEEIVLKLRQVDVLHSQGMAMVDAIRQIGVSEVTFYCWRKEYGGIPLQPCSWKRVSTSDLSSGS